MTIYTLRTTSGREDIVADMMLSKIKAEQLDIKAIVHPAELKGYIFIEGRLGDIHKAIHGMLHIRGLIEKPVKMEEIQHFLDTKKAKIVVGKADIVEIIGGPFKGERGKIERIDKAKDEVTVELLEASVPIPVTIATEFVKLVKRAKGRKAEEAKEEEKQKKEVGLPGAEEIRKGIVEPAEEKPEAPEEEAKPEEAAEKPPEEPRPEEPGTEEKPSILEEATKEKKEEEFEAPETPEEAEALTAPVIPKEEKEEEPKPGEKPPEEKPEEEKKIIKREEPVIMESEEELEKPVIPREEPGEEEKLEAVAEEEDSLLADLKKEKKKKKKSPEDLEEGE